MYNARKQNDNAIPTAVTFVMHEKQLCSYRLFVLAVVVRPARAAEAEPVRAGRDASWRDPPHSRPIRSAGNCLNHNNMLCSSQQF